MYNDFFLVIEGKVQLLRGSEGDSRLFGAQVFGPRQCKVELIKLFYSLTVLLKGVGVRFVGLDSGREPNLSDSESDMSTVHARSRICPCVPPRNPLLNGFERAY